MRYAICFTPSASDPLTLVAANWLGRNIYSGEMVDPPKQMTLVFSRMSNRRIRRDVMKT